MPTTTDGEQKTKPTQHSVKEMRSLGLQPDIVAVRCTRPLRDETKSKISLFCDVPIEGVVSNHDVDDVYRVPLLLEEQRTPLYLMMMLRLYPLEQRTDWVDVCIIPKPLTLYTQQSRMESEIGNVPNFL